VTMASGRPEHRGPPELVSDFIDVVYEFKHAHFLVLR